MKVLHVQKNRYTSVCSCMHSKSSESVKSMYGVWRPYCVQLQAQQVISIDQKHVLCMETLLCAAVGTASYQNRLKACTAYGDPAVCSCRHKKLSVQVRSMYCLWRPYCVQLQAQQTNQHQLEICTLYGNSTVCSCRHSKSSACVSSMYCVWRPYCVQLQAQKTCTMCGRSANMVKNDKPVLNLPALNQLINSISHF